MRTAAAAAAATLRYYLEESHEKDFGFGRFFKSMTRIVANLSLISTDRMESQDAWVDNFVGYECIEQVFLV